MRIRNNCRFYWFLKLVNILFIVYFWLQVNKTSKQKTLGFTVEMKIPVNSGEIRVDGIPFTNELKLGGKIKHKIGSTAVTGTLYMKGMWYKAFGLRWLSFGNINLG